MGRASQQEVGGISKQPQASSHACVPPLHGTWFRPQGEEEQGMRLSMPCPLLLCRWPAKKKWSLETLRKAFAGHDVIAGAATDDRPQVMHTLRLVAGSVHAQVANAAGVAAGKCSAASG